MQLAMSPWRSWSLFSFAPRRSALFALLVCVVSWAACGAAAHAQTGDWGGAAGPGMARYDHVATLLASGEVLLTGGMGTAGVEGSVARSNSAGTGWTGLGDLLEARSVHTATLLPSGKVLVVGGFGGDALASVEIYDPVAGTSAAGPALSVKRGRHTATRLLSGRVLVAGGNAQLGEAEVFVPGSPGSWVATGPVQVRREGASATLLPSGKVLVVGGYAITGVQATAEVYDPATNSWSLAAPMSTPRQLHTATLLPSGEVLVVGGNNDQGAVSSAQVYDPQTNTWGAVQTLLQGWSRHTATLLPNGDVLVAGGDSGTESTAMRYSPTTRTWQADAPLPQPRYMHTATLLGSGDVLVLGGGPGPLSSAVRYRYPQGLWADAQDLGGARGYATAELLLSGKVLLVGGVGGGGRLAIAEIYDPALDQWNPTAPLVAPRYRHASSRLASGRVLVTGGLAAGFNPGTVRTAELYDPVSDTWTAVPDMSAPRSMHTSTLLSDGRVLVVGGDGGGANTAEIYDPATNTWSAAAGPLEPRTEHSAVLLASGKVLVVGGSGGNAGLLTEIYDPATNSWSGAGSLGQFVQHPTLTLLPSGKVVSVGGYLGNDAVGWVFVYDPQGGWTRMGGLPSPRAKHGAVLLPDGRVLVAGGDDTGANLATSGPYDSTLLYDEAADTWTEVARLRTARADLGMVLLPSGRVLAMGGSVGFTQYTAEVDQFVPQFAVTPALSASGYLVPIAPVLVPLGDSTSFDVRANPGYVVASATGCGGALAGTVYTTGPISANCTVSASFAPARTVTATAGAGGSISPSGVQSVADGASATFTVSPQAGYQIASVVGCGGTLVQNTFTTAPVTQNCAVTASFAPILHTVTALAGAGGAISPAGAVAAAQGQPQSFTVAPDAGFRIAAVTGCGGALAGGTYTTAPVSVACTVQARFETLPVPTSTGSGPVSVGVVNASPGCRLDLAATGPMAAPAPYPGAGPLPHGAFRLRLINCQPGETVRVAVTFPDLTGLTVKKYGPTPTSPSASRYYDPANLQISGNTATYDVTDGGLGDDSFGALDGTINDPVVPVPLAAVEAVGIPTLSGGALGGLSLLLAGLAAWQHRRRVGKQKI